MPDSNASWWTRASQSIADTVGLDGAIENLANWWGVMIPKRLLRYKDKPKRQGIIVQMLYKMN